MTASPPENTFRKRRLRITEESTFNKDLFGTIWEFWDFLGKMIKPVESKHDVPKRWLNLREAAAYLNIAYGTAVNQWPSWREHGVKAYKPTRKPLFDINQLDRMVKKFEVQ